MVEQGQEKASVKVVIVSPGDVQIERNSVLAVVGDLNAGLAAEIGIEFKAWRWEDDSRPGLHKMGPQGLIDDLMEIEDSDIVIGIFWTRFGTPVHDAKSGSEHELNRAKKSWDETGRPDVWVYFGEKLLPSYPRGVEEIRQLSLVAEFKESFSPDNPQWSNGLRWGYKSNEEFAQRLKKHLETWLQERAKGGTVSRERVPVMSPNERMREKARQINRTNVFHEVRDILLSSNFSFGELEPLIASAEGLAEKQEMRGREPQFVASLVEKVRPSVEYRLSGNERILRANERTLLVELIRDVAEGQIREAKLDENQDEYPVLGALSRGIQDLARKVIDQRVGSLERRQRDSQVKDLEFRHWLDSVAPDLQALREAHLMQHDVYSSIRRAEEGMRAQQAGLARLSNFSQDNAAGKQLNNARFGLEYYRVNRAEAEAIIETMVQRIQGRLAVA